MSQYQNQASEGNKDQQQSTAPKQCNCDQMGDKQFVDEIRFKYMQTQNIGPYQFWSNQAFQIAQRNGYFKSNFQVIIKERERLFFIQKYGNVCGSQSEVACQVIPKEEFELPWRRECEFLWTVLKELERMKGGGDPELINRLQQEINQLEDELKKLKKKQDDQQLESGKNDDDDKQAEIDRLNKEIQQRNDELEEWRRKIAELQSKGSMVIEEKVTYLSQEVDVWKQKFIKLNHEYNNQQEELIMASAELESFKKGAERKEVVVSRTVKTSSHVTTSQIGSDGTVVTSYQTQES